MGFTPQDILQVTFGPRCHSTIYCGFGNWSRVHFIFFTFVLWSLYMILLKYRNNKSKVCREPNQIGASFRTQSQWSCIRLVFHFSIYLLLPSSSYPLPSMVVSLFLTHLLLEVASSIILIPSPFHFNSYSRSKGLH